MLIPDDHGTYVGGKLVAREIDCEPIKNLLPFGICTFTQKPCVANFVGNRWLNTQEDSYVGGGSEAATTDSFLVCSIGESIVYPSDSGQDPVEVGSILKMLQELIELMQNCPEYFSSENIGSLVLGLGLALFDAGLSDVNGELYALEAAIGQLANAFGDNSRLLDQAWKEFCRHDSTTKSFMERQIENSKNPEAAAFGKFLGSSLLEIAGALGTAKGVMDIILGGGLTVGSIGGSISSGGTAVAFLIPVLTAAGELAAVGVAEVSVGVHAAAGGFANVGDDWERLQRIKSENAGNAEIPDSNDIIMRREQLKEKMKNHIFSKDHIKDGIRKLGDSDNGIMDAGLDIIEDLASEGKIKRGPTQIKTYINGQKVEIKVYINDHGEAISFDMFSGWSIRDMGNTIYIE